MAWESETVGDPQSQPQRPRCSRVETCSRAVWQCSPGTTIFLPAGRQQVLVGRVATETLTCTLTIGLRVGEWRLDSSMHCSQWSADDVPVCPTVCVARGL